MNDLAGLKVKAGQREALYPRTLSILRLPELNSLNSPSLFSLKPQALKPLMNELPARTVSRDNCHTQTPSLAPLLLCQALDLLGHRRQYPRAWLLACCGLWPEGQGKGLNSTASPLPVQCPVLLSPAPPTPDGSPRWVRETRPLPQSQPPLDLGHHSHLANLQRAGQRGTPCPPCLPGDARTLSSRVPARLSISPQV